MKKCLLLALLALLTLAVTSPIWSQSDVNKDFDLEKMATAYWDKKAEPYDLRTLDDIIQRFKGSVVAKQALVIRYTLLKQDPTIEGYKYYLKVHHDAPNWSSALQDLYNLYREYDKIPYWTDFLASYPDTHQGLVAKLHLQTLFAQFVFLSNDETACDQFLEMFPDAPQVPAVMELAEKLALETEKECFSALSAKDERDECANTLVVKWGTWITKYNQMASSQPAEDQASVNMNGESFSLGCKIKRYEKVITTIYAGCPAALDVRSENRHKELMTKLDSIENTLIKNHEDTIKVLHAEFALTRKAFQEECEKLGRKLDKGFSALEKSMDVLHKDMVNVYQELQKVNANLENINKSIERSNELLITLDNDLNITRDSMEKAMAEINDNLVDLGDKIDAAAEVIVDRLDHVIANQYEQMKLTETQIEQAYVMQQSLERIEEGQARQLNALITINSNIKEGFEQTNKTMAFGFESVNKRIYQATNQIIQSNQQMVNQILQAQQQSSSGGGGLFGGLKRAFGKVVKIGATVIGGIYGGPAGAALGAAVGSAVDSAINGGNRKEILNSAFAGGVSQAFSGNSYASMPPQQIYTDIVQEGTTQLKTEVVEQIRQSYPQAIKIVDDVNNLVDKAGAVKDKEITLADKVIPMVESMVKTNVEKRKALAVEAISSLEGKLSKEEIQQITDCKSEKELQQKIHDFTANQVNDKITPDMVNFMMDKVL